MRPIRVEDLERQGRAVAVETERAHRMRRVFSETDALTDRALEEAQMRRKSRAKKPRRRALGLGLGIGLSLATGGALAYGAKEFPEVWSLVPNFLDGSHPPDAPSRGAPNKKSEALEESSDLRRSEIGDELESISAQRSAPATKDAPEGANSALRGTVPPSPEKVRRPEAQRREPPALTTPEAEPSKDETLAEAQRESWKNLASALSQERIDAALTEAERLSSQGSQEEREAAELVAVQLQVKRDGVLSPLSRTRLEKLRARALSENSRREAERLLRQHP